MIYGVIKANWDWFLNYIDLKEITLRVYGREYDVQMGEFPNGSYQTADTDFSKSYEYPGDYEEDGEYKHHETVDEAIDYWLAQPLPDKYERPDFQPNLDAVLSDLAKRDEIPEGQYFIDISW